MRVDTSTEVIILLVAMFLAAFDFAGWYGWIKERSIYDNWKPYAFRVLKALVDYPLTICVVGSVEVLVPLYIFKWFGGCDMIYLVYRILLTKEPMAAMMSWVWWTPYGIITMIMEWNIKVSLTNHSFIAQVAIGAILALITKIILT